MTLSPKTFSSYTVLALLAAAPLAGCGGNTAAPRSAAQSSKSGDAQAAYAPAEESAPSGGAYAGSPEASAQMPYGQMAPSAAPPAAGAQASREAEAADKADERARPGLGTSWGESVSSRVTSTRFVREDFDSPFATATFFYNDDHGVAAMTRGRYVEWSESIAQLGRGITVSVTEPDGDPLRAAQLGSRKYAVGHDGDRYVIRVRNDSPVRLEAVATVDGLDVLDGSDGSLTNRGYVVAPYDSLEIEGFRDSEGTVRAFRFGATDDSYASRSGKGRDVGVIGIAVFQERGSDWRWTPEEVDRRNSADPFPSRFAPPPPSRVRYR